MSSRRESRSRSRTRRLLRALVVLALTAFAALAAAWVWIESAPGQDRIRRGLESRGTSLLGRDVRIAAFELDLLPFNATLTGIEIDGVAGSDQPLFAAAAARVRVRAWALLSRELHISQLDVDTPVVHWDVAEGPGPALDAGGGSRLDLVVDRLSVVDASLELNHRRWNLDTSLIDVSLGLQPVEGATGADRRRSGVLQVRGGGVRIEPDEAASRGVRGELEFVGVEVPFGLDEDLLRIDQARIGIGASELVANGQITEWRSGELSLDGRLDLRDLMALVGIQSADPTAGPADIERVDPTAVISDSEDAGPTAGLNQAESDARDGGDITLASTLTFGDEPLRFSGTLMSPRLMIAGIAAADFSAEVSATADEVLVSAIRASVFQGDVNGRIGVDLTAVPRAWRLEYAASGVDLAELTASEAVPGVRFAGIGAGTATLSWSDPLRETISGAGSFDLSLPSDTLALLAETAAPVLDAPLPRVAIQGGDIELDDPAVSGAATPQRASPSLPLPVEAHAEYSVDAGTVVLQNTSASLPRTRAELVGTVHRDGSIAGQATLESGDLRMLDRFFNQIRRLRGERPVPQPFGIVGRGVVNVSVAGTLEAPSAEGTLEARSLAVANNPIGDVDGSLRLAGAALEISDLRLERDSGYAEGEGRFRIGQRTTQEPDYSVGLRLERFPMTVELPRLGVPLSVAGQTTGELRLTGGYGSSPAGEVRLHGEAVRLNDLRDLSAEVSIRLNPEEWIADRFEIAGPRGRLTASGAWRRADDNLQAYLEAVDVDASIVSDLRGAELPVAGTVRLEAQLSGPFAEPDAAATVRWTNAAAYGVNLGSVASSAELRGRSVAVAAVGRSDLTSTAVPPPTPAARGGAFAVPLPILPDAGWVATLSTDLEAPNLSTLRAAGESSLVLALLAAQGYDPGEDLQVRGALQVSGSGMLGDWRGWTGSAVLAGFALSRPGLTFAIPEPMTLELGNEVLRIDLPRLASDAGSIEIRAAVNVVEERWLEATASGVVSLEVLEVFTDELDSGGTLEVALEAEGNILSGDVAGTFVLRDATFAHPSAPWSVESINGTVRLLDGRLELEEVNGISADRPFAVSGYLPLAALTGDDSSDPVSLQASIDALPLRPLWQRAGPLQELMTGGEASVTLSVQGRGTDWRGYGGQLDVRELGVDLTDLPLALAAPVSLVVRDGGLQTVEPILLQGPGTELGVGGAFMLGPFRLDARLRGFANLDPLNALTGSWGLAGRADIDVGVAGDPPDLSYDGTIDITSGLVNAPILQPIENISATLTLENRLLRVERLTGALGGSGTPDDANVAVSGEIQLVDGIPQRFTLNVGVDEALLRIQRGVRATTSADLVLEGALDNSLLSGIVNVTSGEYTRRWEGESDLRSLSDARVAGVDHPLARSMFLDLSVRAPSDLRIVNNVADVELNADLRVRGTLADPVLLGSTTVLDGSVLLNDQRYRFLRGSIEFQNPLRTEPNLDIAVETSIRQYLVTVNVSGSPVRGDINATFVSSPPLSDLQLIQLLTVGDAPDVGLRNEEDTLGAVGAQATSFLTRQYLNQVERGAQRVFGVDRLRIEPALVNGSGDPTARVTLGKQVTPDLWVSWTSVLGTTDEQLVTLEYQLTRGIQITATREDDGSIGVDVRFDHRFR